MISLLVCTYNQSREIYDIFRGSVRISRNFEFDCIDSSRHEIEKFHSSHVKKKKNVAVTLLITYINVKK